MSRWPSGLRLRYFIPRRSKVAWVQAPVAPKISFMNLIFYLAPECNTFIPFSHTYIHILPIFNYFSKADNASSGQSLLGNSLVPCGTGETYATSCCCYKGMLQIPSAAAHRHSPVLDIRLKVSKIGSNLYF